MMYRVTDDETWDEAVVTMNEHGAEGWRVVHIDKQAPGHPIFIVFEKPDPDSPAPVRYT